VLRQNSSSFLLEDVYRNPGPLQFEGPGADSKPISLCVEDQDYMGRIKKLQEYLEKVVLMPSAYFCFLTHRKPQLTTSFAFAMSNFFLLCGAGEEHCEAWVLAGCS